jgi:nucleoside-diphosphate-sugar epimerase
MQKATNKNRKVYITGASGFVGRSLVPFFLDNGFEVTVLTRDLRKIENFDWSCNVKSIICDLSRADINFEVEPRSGLIHLAWENLDDYDSLHHFEFSLPHSYHFIKSMIQRGIEQVLVAGTCLEYGHVYGPIKSNSITAPTTSYAIAKDNLRKQLLKLQASQKFCLQWARLFYIYGEGQSKKSLVSELNEAVRCGDLAFPMSGGQQLRDFLDVHEAAKQMFSCYLNSVSGPFNICSGRPLSVRTFVEEQARQIGSEIKLELGAYPYPQYEPFSFWGVPNVVETVLLPSLPNAPRSTPHERDTLAPMRIRYNDELDFYENHAFDPSLIRYASSYHNSQAHSKKFFCHMETVLDLLKEAFVEGSKVVEVGCGQGDFVSLLKEDGHFVVTGYDESYSGNDPSIQKRYLSEHDRVDADVVVLRHVLEHIAEPHLFLNMLGDVFGNAHVFIEVPDFSWVLKNGAFFDMTYEHVNYFTETSLKALFDSDCIQYGRFFNDQYHYVLSNFEDLNKNFSTIYDISSWEFTDFRQLFPSMNTLMNHLNARCGQGKIYIWGAATKGCLFISHCKANKVLFDKIGFAVDQNPGKVGKFLPGSNVSIKSPNELFSVVTRNDTIIVVNPAYLDEVREQMVDQGFNEIQIIAL